MSASEKPTPTTLVRRDGTTTQTFGDRRGYTWPPFEPGNTKSLKHGAFSPRSIAARSELVQEALLDVCPWLIDVDTEAIARYCRAEARARMLHEHVMRVADESGVEAVPAYLWTEASRAETNAQKAGQDLGLDPTGRLKIAKDAGLAKHFAGANVGKLVAEGAAIREARS